MKLEINQKLQNSILNIIPKEYNKLEKALFIYNQLCLKLTYSMKAYIDEENNRSYYTNPNNLKNIDGETQTDVVCYTFNYIYLQLLINAGICKENMWEENMPYDLDNPTILKHAHRKLQLDIDGIRYQVDSTFGVLDDNDLTLAKYSTYKFNGWSTAVVRDSDTEKIDKTNIENLDKSIEKIRKDCLKLEENAKRYYELKKADDNFYKISINERVEMFLNEIKNIPDYSLLTFNYLLKLKHKFFSQFELFGEDMKNNIDLLFVKNQKQKEYQAILFVNYNNKLNYIDYDNVETYLIKVKDKTTEKIEVDKLKNLVKTKQLTTRTDAEISKYSMPMIKFDDEMHS